MADATRRQFLKAAGAVSVGAALGGCGERMMMREQPPTHSFDSLFPRFTTNDPLVPIWCVTPKIGRVIHRFHSSSPFSPSGRYLGLTRFPREDRLPAPGDVAEVVLVDLLTGEAKTVAESRGWDTQLGAQVQWGADDTQLFFNDVDTTTWMPFGMCMAPGTGKTKRLDGTVYMASPDGKRVASTCLRRTGATQAGYGVIVPTENVPVNKGAADDDGLYVTSVETGETKLVASYRKIVDEAVPRIDVSRYGPGDFNGFHVKWNSTSDRIMLVLRYTPRDAPKHKPQLITLKPDGSDIRVAIPASLWADRGGVHPNWCPDGEHVLMDLRIKDNDRNYYLVQARYDGSDLHVMADVPCGPGHPTLHPDGRYILTDDYAKKNQFGDGTSPLWWIDLEKETRTTLARIPATPDYWGPKSELRVDLHPAWDHGFRYAAMNAYLGGTRRVLVADLSGLLE